MDDFDEKFNQMEEIKSQMNPTFESAEAISKHLLDVDEYVSNGVNHDSARANLNPNELREARSKGYLIQEIEEMEKICEMDLSIQKHKYFGKLGVLNVTSRSKNGWGSILAKTDKHINVQTAEQMASDISDQFSDETSNGMKQGLLSKLPFLKKQEM